MEAVLLCLLFQDPDSLFIFFNRGNTRKSIGICIAPNTVILLIPGGRSGYYLLERKMVAFQ
jgi:hypothetical protein